MSFKSALGLRGFLWLICGGAWIAMIPAFVFQRRLIEAIYEQQKLAAAQRTYSSPRTTISGVLLGQVWRQVMGRRRRARTSHEPGFVCRNHPQG